MVDAILLILGLSVGVIFLVVLLIGDKRQARLDAQKKTRQDQSTIGNETVEEDKQSPPRFPAVSQSLPPAKPLSVPKINTKIVLAFFEFRGYIIGTVLVAYIIYSTYPQTNFVLILSATAIAFAVLAVVAAQIKKRR